MLDSTITTLLSIDRLYKVTGKDLYDFRQKYRSEKSAINYLPQWTLNTNKDSETKLIESEYFLQFVGHDDADEEEYYLFDLSTTDSLLAEEISNEGFIDLFKEVNWIDLIKDLRASGYKSLDRSIISNAQYVVVQLEYIISHNYEYGDELDEIIVSVIGTLDSNMNKQLRIYNNEQN